MGDDDEKKSIVMCKPEHALSLGYCSWGVRFWFKKHSIPGVTMDVFLSGGIPSDILEKVDDHMAKEIIKEALKWAKALQ